MRTRPSARSRRALLAFAAGRLAADGDGGDAVAVEPVGHEVGVGDADAEAEGPHRRGVDVVGELVQHEAGPGVVAGVEVLECRDVVALAPPPGDVGEVEAVVDAEVLERREVLAVDGVPEAQLGGDAIVEPLQDGATVAALGVAVRPSSSQRRQVAEHPVVGGCGGVVELVDDDDVEVVGRQGVEVGVGEALDRGEDVLVAGGAGAADPLLAERRRPQRVAERGEALVEDLLAVSDEQQPVAVESGPQAGVVDGGHDGLAGAGGGDEQVAVAALATGDLDELEQAFLERVRASARWG